ncbi:hypothetical protein ADICEAN_00197 [Cesiribacter andamanensis AMV16]|uniref:Uncharacterized protein n=1 Tax=Cesiribacter andamanensis AMV16 TaxID=1279009 RepID=M7NSC3_9BACT|nr:hypothetical protein ADICEAN_00197 [Cesiribacter andamanensis AMV16]
MGKRMGFSKQFFILFLQFFPLCFFLNNPNMGKGFNGV